MPFQATAVILFPSGGTANTVTSSTSNNVFGQVIPFNVPIINVTTETPQIPAPCADSNQVVGFVQMNDCDKQDCRITPQNQCYFNPVFGKIIHSLSGNTTISDPSYDNDFSSFLQDYTANIQTSTYWKLQKANNMFFNADPWQWNDVAVLSDDTYGLFYPNNSISGFPTYTGFTVNWGEVVLNFGAGIYRIIFETITLTSNVTIVNGVPVIIPIPQTIMCKASEPFLAREWDCLLAHGTTKFEAWITGNIGSTTDNYKIFNLCGIQWYDSIRMGGFFGSEKAKYDEVILEYQTGQLEEVRDKMLKAFKWDSKYLPKYIHDRFKSYGLMADTLLVSDYNTNNSDYDIKRKGVRKSGNYEPTYNDNKNADYKFRYKQRTSKVSVEFRENVESVIKNICCIPCS